MRPPELQWVRRRQMFGSVAFVIAVFTLTQITNAGPATRSQRSNARGPSASVNIAPRPNFMAACINDALDTSKHCVSAIARALTHALKVEGAPYEVHFANLAHDSLAVQLFVAANIDRAARGLPPVTHLLRDLDAIAKRGALSNSDPVLPAGGDTLVGGQQVIGWGSNWASATYNALGTEYFWMYQDGPGGYNLACRSPSDIGCDGHRANILASYAPSRADCQHDSVALSMGAAAAIEHGVPTFAEIFVATCGAPTHDVVRTWNPRHPVPVPRDGASHGSSNGQFLTRQG